MGEAEEQEMDLPWLPEEMLIRILCFLPREELKRMKLVSKKLGEMCSLSPLPALTIESPKTKRFQDAHHPTSSHLSNLTLKTPTKLSFQIRMEPLPNLMFDESLSFLNALDDRSFPPGCGLTKLQQRLGDSFAFPDSMKLSLTNAIESFLDLMFGSSPTLKDFIADLVLQSQTVRGYFPYLFPKPVLPFLNASGSSSSFHRGRHLLHIAKLHLVHDCDRTKTMCSQADMLIKEAVERKVKELRLRSDEFLLTLRVLSLRCCHFELGNTVVAGHLPALRELNLASSSCDHQSVKKLLSSCPPLESLSL